MTMKTDKNGAFSLCTGNSPQETRGSYEQQTRHFKTGLFINDMGIPFIKVV